MFAGTLLAVVVWGLVVGCCCLSRPNLQLLGALQAAVLAAGSCGIRMCFVLCRVITFLHKLCYTSMAFCTGVVHGSEQ
jgi:hypothetical protein